MDPWEEGRTRKPFGTAIASWLAQAYYRRPNAPELVLAPPPRSFRVPLSDRVVLQHFRGRGGQAPARGGTPDHAARQHRADPTPAAPTVLAALHHKRVPFTPVIALALVDCQYTLRRTQGVVSSGDR